jgi:lysophospholipase L1-like esterase
MNRFRARAVRDLGAPAIMLFSLMFGAGCGEDVAPPEPGSDEEGPAISGGVRWLGRVDLADPAAPKFAWSNTGWIATVAGTSVAVTLRSDAGSDAIYFQPVIDGVPGERFSVAASEGDKTVTLGADLEDGDHLVELYRETEGKSNFAYSTFLGFTEGETKEPPAYGDRLIEIIGDSISAGYGNLGAEEHPNYGADPDGGCRFSTETESAYLTYGAVAARAVGAEASILAASGWGIYSDNGGNRNNVLPLLFDKTVGGRAMPIWGFKRKPQAVVINLGTNDFYANMTLAADAFTPPFQAFIATVREKYPNALIYCAIGPLLYSTGLSNARMYIADMVASLNDAGDDKVKVLDFGQQNTSLGTGCDYHPNATENQRMADRLADELRTDLGW